MEAAFEAIKETLSQLETMTIDEKEELLSYIKGNLELPVSTKHHTEAYTLGFAEGVSITSDNYKRRLTGEQLCNLVVLAFNKWGVEYIGELYDVLAYRLKFNATQIELWLNIISEAQDIYMHREILSIYEARYADHFNFMPEDDAEMQFHTITYGKFMKIMKVWNKSTAKYIVRPDFVKKSKLSFKRSTTTTIVNHEQPNAIYRDNGWIEGSNYQPESLDDTINSLTFKQIKLE